MRSKLLNKLITYLMLFALVLSCSKESSEAYPELLGLESPPTQQPASPFDVNINQAAAQADPTDVTPIFFNVIFSRAIDPASFTPADITNAGTATGITWQISNSGNNITFNLYAMAVTTQGSVIPVLATNAVMDKYGNGNLASISIDNSVFYATQLGVTNIIEPVDNSYGEGAELIFQVVYAEAIDITGFPRIPITVGAVTRYAIYSQGDGTSGIEFKYTV